MNDHQNPEPNPPINPAGPFIVGEVDLTPYADEASESTSAPAAPSQTEQARTNSSAEPKTPEEIKTAQQSLLCLAKTLVARGKPKSEVMERLKVKALEYSPTPLLDATAEIFYNGALGYPAEWYPRSLKEIANRAWDTPHQIPWIIEGILPAASSLLCSGQPHATKSLDWLSACIEATVKHTVWGKFDASKVRRALYIETEDPDWMVENRIVGLMKGFGLVPTDALEKYGFYFSATGPFDLVGKEQQIRSLINHVKPDFIVLSTLQGLIPGRSLSEQKDMSEPNAMVVRLAKLTPMVVITHSPRDSSLRRSYGTIVQDANYLTLMHFEKHIQDGTTTINVIGDSKLGTELNFKLRLVTEVTEHTEVRGVFHMDHIPDTRDRIIECKKGNPKMKVTDVAKIVGCSYEYARRVLKDAGCN
jgi:hypothetical protein